MRAISGAEYDEMRRGAKVIEKDGHGDKVLFSPDGKVIKLFRIKRVITRARLDPYAERFARNSRALLAKGLRSVDVLDVFDCPEIERQGVVYSLLPGEPLRATEGPALMEQFARYVAELHNKGVYFRSLHLGNVLLLPDGGMGLIDVSEMRVHPRALGLIKRARNFKHIFRLRVDRERIAVLGVERFFEVYLDASGLTGIGQYVLRRLSASLAKRARCKD